MKKRNLFPLALFCLVFLAYSLYFVKVINTTRQLESDSIAKTIRRVIDQREIEEITDEDLTQKGLLPAPITRYVNYRWLNVRQKPSLASPVVEKIYENDAVQVKGYPTDSWAFVSTQAGTDGYVARRYLRDEQATLSALPEKPEAETNTPETNTPNPIPSETATSGSESQIYDIPVITYHHISDQTDFYPPSMVLPDVNLISQLDYLIGNGFKTYTFADLKAIRDGAMTASDKAVILTFNGGYDDAYLAAQHLNGKGLKGVFFITTDKIGTEGYLDWRQVKKMHDWGMEIGSMGVTGANLLNTGEFYVADEIERSKQIIEDQIGTPVLVYAYANGGYNDAIAKAVQEAGYAFARTSDDGSRFSSKQYYTIPTLRVFFPAGANQFRAWLTQ